MIRQPARILLARAFSTSARCNTQEDSKRLLRVAIVGAPNAGKSTLLNKLIYSEISCISNKVHTTRANVLGVLTENDAQLVFLDSPGVVAKKHLFKHHLEDSLHTDPKEAAKRCDIIAVIVDAANIREQKRLNRGILELLFDHPDKQSVLVLNKVDIIKEKRILLDITTRLTQGCLEGRLQMDINDLRGLERTKLRELNLMSHFGSHAELESGSNDPSDHKYVIDLEKSEQLENVHRNSDHPDSIGYKNFSRVFSISALNDDGVDELRDYFTSLSQPVETWPHGPDYLSNMNAKDVVHSIIRGRVMDAVPHALPYLLEYKYLSCQSDENGSLHVHLRIKCPQRYMVGQVIGDKGSVIFRIIGESRELIAKTLGCDVKLNIEVQAIKKKILATQ